MPRVRQSVLLGAIAVFLAPPVVNGFGGLNYLRSSSTNSRPITVPKSGGPTYLFMPVGDTDYHPDGLEWTAPSPPTPKPPPSTCCVVYPQGTCPNCYLNSCNDCCEYVQLWEVHPTLQPYPPPYPPP